MGRSGQEQLECPVWDPGAPPGQGGRGGFEELALATAHPGQQGWDTGGECGLRKRERPGSIISSSEARGGAEKGATWEGLRPTPPVRPGGACEHSQLHGDGSS